MYEFPTSSAQVCPDIVSRESKMASLKERNTARLVGDEVRKPHGSRSGELIQLLSWARRRFCAALRMTALKWLN